MPNVIQDAIKSTESRSLLFFHDPYPRPDNYISETGYYIPNLDLIECGGTGSDLTQQSRSACRFGKEKYPRRAKDWSFSVKRISEFADQAATVSEKQNSDCSLALDPGMPYKTSSFFSDCASNKASSPSISVTPRAENSSRPNSAINSDAFSFGIDTYFHGTQFGFGPQISFKRVSPMESSLFSLRLPSETSCSAHSEKNDKNLAQLGPRTEVKVPYHTNQKRPADFFCPESGSQISPEPSAEPLAVATQDAKDTELLPRDYNVPNIVKDPSIQAQNNASQAEKAPSSRISFYGLISSGNFSNDAIKEAKLGLPENRLRKNDFVTPSERTLLAENFHSSKDTSEFTARKLTLFTPSTLSHSQVSTKQGEEEMKSIRPLDKPVSKKLNSVAPLNFRQPFVPLIALPRHRTSKYFTSASLGTFASENEIPSQLNKASGKPKDKSTILKKRRYCASSGRSSLHICNSCVSSNHTRVKSLSSVLSEIKIPSSSGLAHKLNPYTSGMPVKLPILSQSKTNSLEMRPHLNAEKSKIAKLLRPTDHASERAYFPSLRNDHKIVERPQKGNTARYRRLPSKDGVAGILTSQKDKGTDPSKPRPRQSKIYPKAAHPLKACIGGKAIEASSTITSVKVASARRRLDRDPFAATNLSHRSGALTSCLCNARTRVDGGDALLRKSMMAPEAVAPQFAPQHNASCKNTLQIKKSDFKGSVLHKTLSPINEVKMQCALEPQQSSSQKIHTCSPHNVSQLPVDNTMEEISLSDRTPEKVSKSKISFSKGTSLDEVTRTSSPALGSLLGTIDSTTQEPAHQRTLRLWMDQFKNGGYYWYTPSQYTASSDKDCFQSLRDKLLKSSELPNVPSKTESARAHERRERVAGLLARRKEKRQTKQQDRSRFQTHRKGRAQSPSILPISKDVPDIGNLALGPAKAQSEVAVAVRSPHVEKAAPMTVMKHDMRLGHSTDSHGHTRLIIVLTKQPGDFEAQACAEKDDDRTTEKSNVELVQAAHSVPLVKVAVKDSHTLQVCVGSPEERSLFTTDEVVQTCEKQEPLYSSCLSDSVKKVLSGMNVAVLLSSTEVAKFSSPAVVLHILTSLMRDLPPTSVLSWSVCAIKDGKTNNLDLTEGLKGGTSSRSKLNMEKKPLTGVALHTAALKGLLLKNVAWTAIKDHAQVSDQLFSAYHQVNLHSTDELNTLVISLVLKQVADAKGNARISSLSLIDTGANHEKFAHAVRSAGPGPYDTLQNILCRSDFAVLAVCVSHAESTHVFKLLHSQRRLCDLRSNNPHGGDGNRPLRPVQRGAPSVRGNKSTLTKLSMPTAPVFVSSKNSMKMALSPYPTLNSLPVSSLTLSCETVRLKQNAPISNNNEALHFTTAPTHALNPLRTTLDDTSPSSKSNLKETTSDNTAHQSLYDALKHGHTIAPINLRYDGPVVLKGNDTHDARLLPGATFIGPHGEPAWSQLPSTATQNTNLSNSGLLMVTSDPTKSIGEAFTSRKRFEKNKSKPKTEALEQASKIGLANQPSSHVRTLVILDLQEDELLQNITFDDNVVFVTGKDDFDDYEMDEVIELPRRGGVRQLQSKLLEELCETICRGCNAALLCGATRSFSMSPLVLNSIVHSIFFKLEKNKEQVKRSDSGVRSGLTVSVVEIKGEMVRDLLDRDAEPQKLVIAISPIFGSCVHGVRYQPVEDSICFERTLKNALARSELSSHEKDDGFVFCCLIFKIKHANQSDVLVCSLVASLAHQNVGIYRSVLECNQLVPRALFHYALGGPCRTVALLGIGWDTDRVKQMLDIQKDLRRVKNRPTHPGSILKFIKSLREGLIPTLSEELNQVLTEKERMATTKVMCRVQGMIEDAEILLQKFEDEQPKAYVNDGASARSYTNSVDGKTSRRISKLPHDAGLLCPHSLDAKINSTRSSYEYLIRMNKESIDQASSHTHCLKLIKEPKDSYTNNRIRSLVCFDKRLLGGGSAAVKGKSILLNTKKGPSRFDADEVIVRDGSDQPIPDSELITEALREFLNGCNTGLLAADSGSCAFTLLMLHKIVSDVLSSMNRKKRDSDNCSWKFPSSTLPRNFFRSIKSQLRVSMAIIKDGITTDLLCCKAGSSTEKFSMGYSAIFGSFIQNLSTHVIDTIEDFDQFFSNAIDNADPALQTEDPGVMVISLLFTNFVREFEKEDVFASTFTATTVFDAVHHYLGILECKKSEPLELFRNLVGGASNTVALVGISDEDKDSDKFLTVLDRLSRIVNRPSEPNSMNKLMQLIELNQRKLTKSLKKAKNSEETAHLTNSIHTLEVALSEVKEFTQSQGAGLGSPFPTLSM